MRGNTEPLFDHSMRSQSKPTPTSGGLPGWATQQQQQHLSAMPAVLWSLQSPLCSPSPTSPPHMTNSFQVKGFSASTGGFGALSAAANGGFASAGGGFGTVEGSSAAASGSFGTAIGVSRATAGATHTTAGVFPFSTCGLVMLWRDWAAVQVIQPCYCCFTNPGCTFSSCQHCQ